MVMIQSQGLIFSIQMIDEFIYHGRKVTKNHPKIKAIWSQGNDFHFNSRFESFWEIESITSHFLMGKIRQKYVPIFRDYVFWEVCLFSTTGNDDPSFWCFKKWSKIWIPSVIPNPSFHRVTFFQQLRWLFFVIPVRSHWGHIFQTRRRNKTNRRVGKVESCWKLRDANRRRAKNWQNKRCEPSHPGCNRGKV